MSESVTHYSSFSRDGGREHRIQPIHTLNAPKPTSHSLRISFALSTGINDKMYDKYKKYATRNNNFLRPKTVNQTTVKILLTARFHHVENSACYILRSQSVAIFEIVCFLLIFRFSFMYFFAYDFSLCLKK